MCVVVHVYVRDGATVRVNWPHGQPESHDIFPISFFPVVYAPVRVCVYVYDVLLFARETKITSRKWLMNFLLLVSIVSSKA